MTPPLRKTLELQAVVGCYVTYLCSSMLSVMYVSPPLLDLRGQRGESFLIAAKWLQELQLSYPLSFMSSRKESFELHWLDLGQIYL